MPEAHTFPVLYSFRRCPYAMRARLAIRYSQIQVELREVTLKNKPQEMLLASPKATVPVLVLHDGTVIDESLDIIYWALNQYDPEGWLVPTEANTIDSLIKQNDNEFKTHLDHYKYADRFPEHNQTEYRTQGEAFIQLLECRLSTSNYLLGDKASIADLSIFPFIRQFAHVDIEWFKHSDYTNTYRWLCEWMESDLFQSIMQKHPAWDNTQDTLFS